MLVIVSTRENGLFSNVKLKGRRPSGDLNTPSPELASQLIRTYFLPATSVTWVLRISSFPTYRYDNQIFVTRIRVNP